MAILKEVDIDGKKVAMKASAAVPRMYRLMFQRDIYKDMIQLEQEINENETGLDIGSLEIFENVAYIFAKHANPDIPNSPDEWLEGFNMFSIYEIFPKLIELWAINTEQEVTPKKKAKARAGK